MTPTTDDGILRLVAETARRLNDREPEIARAMSRLMAREISHLDEDRHLVEMLQASVDANVKTIIHVLANRIPIEHLQPTTAATEYALRLAQRDIPAHSLVRAYHMGQNEFIEACFTEVRRLECSAELRLDVLHHISNVLYRYIDWISLYVLDTYEKEKRRWISSRGNLRSSLIHKIVAGQPVNISVFEQETGYRLDQFHVGMVVWSTSEAPEPEEPRRLERFVLGLAARCRGTGQPLVTAIDRSMAWAWLPFGSRQPALDVEEIRELTAGLAKDCRLALGLPAHGLAGFRRSREQAQSARDVALASVGPAHPVVSFGDQGVAVVSLLAKDMDSTRRWVREVLGPLAGDDDHAAELRRTLHAFFSTGENYGKAAELLNVHRNTVKYRVSKVLDSPGLTAAHDRMDIALALQICHFLGPAALPGTGLGEQ
ncbi:helix-turn-helix domain-containing protein [Streptomyces shenzhenensis]|uniref:PucR family transcriptional regulator n=1 Tax=Streptomyces TaxID=1883 RepID=UPI001F2C4B46|nr:helix-turn-helix domain-containing protein [Streptomyces shenzhenensis]